MEEPTEWKLLKMTGKLERLREDLEGMKEKISFIPDCLSRSEDINKETTVNITNHLHRLDSIESKIEDVNQKSIENIIKTTDKLVEMKMQINAIAQGVHNETVQKINYTNSSRAELLSRFFYLEERVLLLEKKRFLTNLKKIWLSLKGLYRIFFKGLFSR